MCRQKVKNSKITFIYEGKEKESWAIIPIHTDKPEEFAQLFSNEWQISLLNDGDSSQLRIAR